MPAPLAPLLGALPGADPARCGGHGHRLAGGSRQAGAAGGHQAHRAGHRAERDPAAGLHLVGAGQARPAVPYLLEAADQHWQRGDLRGAVELLDVVDGALEDVGDEDEDGDGRRVASASLRVRILLRTLDLPGVMQHAPDLVAAAAEAGDREAGFDALTAWGIVEHSSGNIERAIELLERARDLVTDPPDPVRLGRFHACRSAIPFREGRFDEALDHISESVRYFDLAGDIRQKANAMRGVASILVHQGDLDRALELVIEASQMLDMPGGQIGRAHCLSTLAGIAERTGQPDEAERHYRSAIEAYARLGSRIIAYPHQSLAMLLVRQSRFDEAWLELERSRHASGAAGERLLLATSHVIGAAVSAGRGDEDAFQRDLSAAEEAVVTAGFGGPPLAAMATIAADLAEAAGDASGAARARALAADLDG